MDKSQQVRRSESARAARRQGLWCCQRRCGSARRKGLIQPRDRRGTEGESLQLCVPRLCGCDAFNIATRSPSGGQPAGSSRSSAVRSGWEPPWSTRQRSDGCTGPARCSHAGQVSLELMFGLSWVAAGTSPSPPYPGGDRGSQTVGFPPALKCFDTGCARRCLRSCAARAGARCECLLLESGDRRAKSAPQSSLPLVGLSLQFSRRAVGPCDPMGWHSGGSHAGTAWHCLGMSCCTVSLCQTPGNPHRQRGLASPSLPKLHFQPQGGIVLRGCACRHPCVSLAAAWAGCWDRRGTAAGAAAQRGASARAGALLAAVELSQESSATLW